ncbi:MAG: flagellar biosynthesis repressor FlbT [Hyphomicrobiaceae bacterium]
MKSLRISLRAGERIYVNGAVLQPDRKVSLEFLNEVTFLLESHVIQVEDTTTPLRQLYFIAQTMLMEPKNAPETLKLFEASHALLRSSFENDEILAGLAKVRDLVATDRVYEALKVIRVLFPLEAAILGKQTVVNHQTLEIA